MHYRHPTGVRLALLSGHVAHVGPEWTELHDRFHLVAVNKGCEIQQNEIPAVATPQAQASAAAMVNTDQDSIIRRALEKMLERNEEGDFTNTDLPSLPAVEKLAGVQVGKGDVYRIFREMKAEAGVGAAAEGAE